MYICTHLIRGRRCFFPSFLTVPGAEHLVTYLPWYTYGIHDTPPGPDLDPTPSARQYINMYICMHCALCELIHDSANTPHSNPSSLETQPKALSKWSTNLCTVLIKNMIITRRSYRTPPPRFSIHTYILTHSSTYLVWHRRTDRPIQYVHSTHPTLITPSLTHSRTESKIPLHLNPARTGEKTQHTHTHTQHTHTHT